MLNQFGPEINKQIFLKIPKMQFSPYFSDGKIKYLKTAIN